MDQKWLTLLSKASLFQNISSDALTIMLHCLQPKIVSYPKNSYITFAGDAFLGLGILLSGEAAVIKENAAGHRMIMVMLKAGDMFGEMAAFSANKIWPASVTAQIDSTVMFLQPEKIVGTCANVCSSHQQLVINMLRILSDKALLLNRKLAYFGVKSIRGKISLLLQEQYRLVGSEQFVLPFNRNEMADFLNVSRVALSREMGRIRDEGIIEFHKSSIQIKNLAALQKFIE